MFLRRHPHLLVFLSLLALFTLGVTLLSEAMGTGALTTSFTKILGQTLCLCLIAIAMDLVWGFAGILSLGHFAFFGLGGYMIGMWLMYERTRLIVEPSLLAQALPPTAQEVQDAIAAQIFGVVGASELPAIWTFAGSLPAQLALVVLVPGLLALVFGWLAFRSRVTGVYLSILTQAMTLALALYLFQNESGLRGNNGLSGLQNIPHASNVSQAWISLWFVWGSALALAIGYVLATWIVSGKFGSVIRGIRDDEARVRFLGYPVETYKLFVFTLSAVMAGIAGALYYPQAGIINPAELAPVASIYLAVWVAIGGRGRLWGAVLGAASVSLVSNWFSGGGAPDVTILGYTIAWVSWWQVMLGLGFVLVTIFAPKGLSGLVDLMLVRRDPSRGDAAVGRDDGSLRDAEEAR